MKLNGAITVFLAAVSFCGIIRHDVSEEKYLALARQPQFDCAGQLFNLKKNKAGGSCVLIAPRYIITAGHCLLESVAGSEGHFYAASDLLFKFGNKSYRGKAIFVHPSYPFRGGVYDLAIVELDEKADGIDPAVLNLKYDELHSIVTGVGYGASGPADKPSEVIQLGKKIAGQNTIDSIGGYVIEGSNYPAILYADFDHPGNKTCNLIGSSQPLPLEYSCTGGDSGSGLFRQEGSQWTLIGICAGGPGTNVECLARTGYYGQLMGWTRTSPFSEWIKKTIKEN